MSDDPAPLPADSHAFVVRMRLETSRRNDPANPENRRVMVRIEDVQKADVSQHDTIDNALGWLRTRMSALLPQPSSRTPPPDRS